MMLFPANPATMDCPPDARTGDGRDNDHHGNGRV